MRLKILFVLLAAALALPAAAQDTPAQKPAAKSKKTAAKAPEKRCFQVRHVSGTSGIRCNDDPGVPDPVPKDARTRSESKAGLGAKAKDEVKAE